MMKLHKIITRLFLRGPYKAPQPVDTWYLTTEVLPISDTPFQAIIHDIDGSFRVSNAIFDKKTHKNNRDFPLIELQFPEWWEGVKKVSVSAWKPLPEIPEWIKVHCEQAREASWNDLWERHMRYMASK